MQRLRGSDAQTIYTETATSPFATLKALIYEPTDPDNPINASELAEFIKAHTSGWIKRGLGFRVVRVPFDIHHPLWIADKNFQLSEHIHRIALPSPGDDKAFCRLISYVMSLPLDPARPLWDSWVVEGLEGGRVAWVLKIHHVLGDGIMSSKNLIDLHKTPETSTNYPEVARNSEEVPGEFQLIAEGIKDLIKSYFLELPKYLRQYRIAKNTNKPLTPLAEEAYGPFMAPFTLLNNAGGSYRSYRYVTFSLLEFKALSRKLDCTINDLVLGICAEALKRYLQEYENLPDTPLVAVMPVSNHGTGGEQKFLNTDILNNNVNIAFVPLDLTIDDFKVRLKAIQRGARAAIEKIQLTHGTRMENYVDFMPGTFFRLLNWFMARRQKKKKKPLANVSISNVPGPREPLYACDGKLKMVQLLSCGNLTDTNALGITVWSFLDKLSFSCFFRKGTAPDPDKFAAHIDDIYQEILAAENEKETLSEKDQPAQPQTYSI